MAKTKSYEAIRGEIGQLAEGRRQIENAPLTREELLDQLDEVIAYHAADVSSSLAGVINTDKRDFMFLSEHINASTLRSALCAFAPDALRTHFVGKVDAYLEGKRPMTADDKKARLAEIDQKLHDLQLDEEEALNAAEAAGAPIARRHDVDPDIFLEVHGPDGVRAKLRTFKLHAMQLHAATDTIHKAMEEARTEMQRAAAARDNHRTGVRRVRDPVPFRDQPAGQGERVMLITENPKEEARLLKWAEEAKAAFDALQAEYQAAGERNGEFGTGYQRLKEALAGRAAAAA